MKALQLSGFALCLLGIFSSCTKDTISSSSQDSLNSTNSKTGVLGENKPNQATATKVDPSLIVIYDPTTGIKGEEVTVTGTFDETTGVAVPDCGKLQLQQLVNGQWVGLGSPVNVTATNHEVTYTFTPELVGEAAYSFKLHYIAAGCDGFSETKSEGFPLNVIEPCLPLALKGELTKYTQLEGNKYQFEVTYTVTSCPAMGAAKLQGGLTAVTGFTEAGMWTSDAQAIGQERKNTHNDNHIIQWDFNIGQNYSNTFTVRFTKELKGAGPYELTGQWSVSAKDPATGLEVKPTAAPITFTK